MARLFMICAPTVELAFARVHEITGGAEPTWRAVGEFESARAEDLIAGQSQVTVGTPYCLVFEYG